MKLLKSIALRIVGYGIVVLTVIGIVRYFDVEKPYTSSSTSEEIFPFVPVDYEAFVARRLRAPVSLSAITLDDQIYSEVLDPYTIKVLDGDLYVPDWGDGKLKRFDQTGRLLAEIGAGHGAGPGEMRSIMDYAINGGIVWTVSGSDRLIARFDTSGQLLSQFKTVIHPGRVMALPNGNIVVSGLGREQMFHEYDAEGNLLRSFGQVFDDQEVSDGMILIGRFLRTKEASFVYVLELASKIYTFEDEGQMIGEVESIDDYIPERPSTQNTSAGAMVVAPNTQAFVENASVDGDTLYLHSYHKGEKDESTGEMTRGPESYIDRYLLSTGQYLDSIKMPFWSHSAHVMDNKIFCIRGDSAMAVLDMVFE